MKILMADYYGVSDSSGNVLGHSVKALHEYSSMLAKEHDVYAAVSPCIYKALQKDAFSETCLKQVTVLPCDIPGTAGYGLVRRVADKFRLFANIRQIYREMDQFDVVWFYRTDFFLFLYAALHRKPRRCRVVYLVYHSHFTGGRLEGLLQSVYRKAQAKADLIIYTGKTGDGSSTGEFRKLYYMPDFTYDPGAYRKYSKLSKEDKCVCIGTMNPYKQLEEMVDAFRVNGRHLQIAGRFYDQERALRLLRNSTDNITVRDVVLDADEYLSILGSAEYAVLPYDMTQYQGRSSGVLQECMFLKTIPVAPRQLLEDNEMPGLGYESPEDMKDNSFFESADKNDLYARMSDYCSMVDYGKVSERLLKMFGGLAGTNERETDTD